MPLSTSVLASQLADNCVVELVVEMSAPTPSRTLAGALGGVMSTTVWPLELVALPVSPAPLMALDAEVVGLPIGQRQAGLGDCRDVAQRSPIDGLRAAGRGADGVLVAADAAFVVGAGVPVGRQLRGGTGGRDIRAGSIAHVGRRAGRRDVESTVWPLELVALPVNPTPLTACTLK